VQQAIARPAQIVQRHAAPSRVPQPVPRAASSAVLVPPNFAGRPTGAGQPLHAHVRQKMEALFGASFADVRVHVGPHVVSIGALAFTQGADVHFAPGQYNPFTPRGHHLLAHELTHVVQQRSGRVRNPFHTGVAIVNDRFFEAEAERMGIRAAIAPRLPIIQRAMEAAEDVEDFVDDDEDQEVAVPDGLDSRALFRVMPEHEWHQMQGHANQPCSGGHFWSSTEVYVRKYFGKVDTTSNIFIKIPLTCTVLDLLKATAAKKKLHPHNFGKAWKQLFGKGKASKGKSDISLKNDNGTATVTFNFAPGGCPAYLVAMMGAPEQLVI